MEHSRKKEVDFQLADRETANCWPSGTCEEAAKVNSCWHPAALEKVFGNAGDSQGGWAGPDRSAHTVDIAALVWRLTINNKKVWLLKGMLKQNWMAAPYKFCLHTFGKAKGWALKSLHTDERGACLGSISPFLHLQKSMDEVKERDKTCLCLNLWSLSEGYVNISKYKSREEPCAQWNRKKGNQFCVERMNISNKSIFSLTISSTLF